MGKQISLVKGGGGGGGSWGSISGTLENQTDLKNALDNKIPKDGQKVLSTNDYSDNEKNKYTIYANITALKAVNTTSLTSGILAEVLDMGLFKLDKTSTATGDDLNIIVPTSGTGRWLIKAIAGRILNYPNYTFDGIDSGAYSGVASYNQADGSLSLSDGTAIHNCLWGCAEMHGKNKYLKFTALDVLKDLYFGLRYNGSKNKMTSALAGYFIYVLGSGTIAIKSAFGASPTETTKKTLNVAAALINTNPISVIIKTYEDRISLAVIDEKRRSMAGMIWFESTEFRDLAGTLNAISQIVTAPAGTKYTALKFSDLVPTAGSKYKNIIAFGDSQTSASYLPTYNYYPERLMFNNSTKNLDVINKGVAGHTIGQLVSRYAADVLANKSLIVSNMENIVILYIGVNDVIAGSSAATIMTALESLMLTMKGGTLQTQSTWANIAAINTQLGNCATINKTLTMVVDGVTRTVVFDQDYTSVGAFASWAAFLSKCTVTGATTYALDANRITFVSNTNKGTVTLISDETGIFANAVSQLGFKICLVNTPALGSTYSNASTRNPIIASYNALQAASTTPDWKVDLYSLITPGGTPYSWALFDNLHMVTRAQEILAQNIATTIGL